MIRVDYDITEQFLEIMLGEGWEDVNLILQSYDDNKDRMADEAQIAKATGKKYSSQRAHTFQGTWGELRRRVQLMAEDGCAICWTLQEFAGKRQDKPEFFRAFRGIVLDFDACQSLPEFPLPPHCIVESSPKKYHAYFRGILDRLSFLRLMSCLVAKYGADDNAKDVCRVLRLPGTPWQKVDSKKGLNGLNGHEPHIVSIVRFHLDPPYTASEMLDAFAVVEWEKKGDSRGEKKTASRPQSYPKILPASSAQNLFDVAQALSVLPADDRGAWLTVGMSLASLKQVEARALWDEWSKKSSKFEPHVQDMTWDSFKENRERVTDQSERVGIGTLFHLARQHGWTAPSADAWRKGLLLDSKGDPKECASNIALILSNHPEWRGKFCWDTVRTQPLISEDPLTDLLISQVATWLGVRERLPLHNLALLEKEIRAQAMAVPRDLIQEWLASLPPWDGIERLPEWLLDITGAEKNEMGMAASRLIIVAMVARALEPGCIFRIVFVLEGPENSGKTTLVRALGGAWYSNLSTNIETKEAYMAIQGVWVAEMSELEGLSKTEENRLKNFITATKDDWIPKFSNERLSIPRRTIFIGTTNESEYLKGMSGNTRFIPIRTGPIIDIELFREIREQLFAEALAWYKDHKKDWWHLPEEASRQILEARKDRQIENGYKDALNEWLRAHRPEETSWPDIATCFLKIDLEKWKDKNLQMQIAQALRLLGWEKRTVRREGTVRKVWINVPT